jgi:hypothetical protein
MTVAKVTFTHYYDQIGYGTQLPLLRLGTCRSTVRELNLPRFEYADETSCSPRERIEKCRVSYVETTSLSIEFSTGASSLDRHDNSRQSQRGFASKVGFALGSGQYRER